MNRNMELKKFIFFNKENLIQNIRTWFIFVDLGWFTWNILLVLFLF